MAPSKNWMTLSSIDRLCDEYSQGVKEFISFAFSRLGERTKVIKCPCVKCCNSSKHTRETIEMHLIVYGILEGYTFWWYHGESLNKIQTDDNDMDEESHSEEEGLANDSTSDDEVDEIIRDIPIYHELNQKGVEVGSFSSVDVSEESNDDAKKSFRQLKDLQQRAYPGSNCSKLSAHISCRRTLSLKSSSHMRSLEQDDTNSIPHIPQDEVVRQDEVVPQDAVVPSKISVVVVEHAGHEKLQRPPWYERDIMQLQSHIDARCYDPPIDGLIEAGKSDLACTSSRCIDGSQSTEKKQKINSKPRGMNKVKEVATLRDGEKLDVIFYNKRPVGKNGKVFSRNLGKLVRDRNMLPVKVHSWDEIDCKDLDKLWASVLDKFQGDDIENRRDDVMSHARKLWNSWRGSLMQLHLKEVSSLEEALKEDNLPKSLHQEDWEWLVLEHYTDPSYAIKSARNSENRAYLTMPHRTGSKPIREIIYENLGGKEGKVPDLADIFKESRKRRNGTLVKEDAEIYDMIKEKSSKNPSILQYELVEKCFGAQEKGHVICFGSGVKPCDLRGPEPSKEDLKTQLQEKDQIISKMSSRLEHVE